MDGFKLELTPLLLSLGHLLLGIVVLVLAKFTKDWLSPYSIESELTEKDNPAFGLALAGYYGAVVIIFISVTRMAPAVDELSTATLLNVYGADLGWSLLGLAALAFSRWMMDATLMATTHFSAEIVSGRNTAAGAVECGVYLACGVVLSSVLREPGGTWITILVFFLLSQATLLLLGRLYSRMVGYDMVGQIRDKNLAAGVALAFTLVAFSLLIAKGTSGEFVSWPVNLSYFAFDAVAGLILLLFLRWLTDLALLPNARIADEIVRDRNVNAGLIEGVVALGIAFLILFVF
ncbi:MAG: DUF350 domain-containing protein [Bryobacteraceae bacterium]|nr:DUF350 domain-containing protein [Bryobacteraceae bacterium]